MVWIRQPEILLCPNIPKPLHGVAPRAILGRKWWDKTRKEAYKSCNYRCQSCGVHQYRAKYHEWLEGHELYDTDYKAGRLTYLRTVPLCHFCHNFIHDGRLNHLLEKGQIHHAKFVAILQHGTRVLNEAGLNRPTYSEREAGVMLMASADLLAPWETWRMKLLGKLYPPKHKTYEDWKEHFGIA